MDNNNFKLPQMYSTSGGMRGRVRFRGGVAPKLPNGPPPGIPNRWGPGVPLPRRYKELEGFLPPIEKYEMKTEKEIFAVPKDLLRQMEKRGYTIGGRRRRKAKTNVSFSLVFLTS